MERRNLLLALGCVAGGGYAVGTQDIDIASLSFGKTGNSSNPMETTFSSLSGSFEKLVWDENGRFTVTIAEETDMDGFGVRHELVDGDDYDGYTLFHEVEQFGGEVTVDFESSLDTTYPSRSFSLVGLKGQINKMMPYIEERTVSVAFTAPSEAVTDDHFQ